MPLRIRGDKLGMAAAAKLRDMGAVGLVLRIQMRFCFVVPVTLSAVGSILLFLLEGLPVGALKKILGNLGMAGGAVHPAGRFTGTLQVWGNIRMAFDTGDISVDGLFQVILVGNMGDRLPGFRGLSLDFAVAVEAFPVRSADDQIGPVDGMRSMAVRTGRDGAWLSFPELTRNHLGVDLFDPSVADHTGFCDVAHGYR